MRSALPKVLHPVAGVPMLDHSIAAARATEPDQLVVVVRHQRELVADHLRTTHPDVTIADQDDVPGTGRAVQCALAGVDVAHHDVLVTCADTPLLRGGTLTRLCQSHRDASAMATMLTARPGDPTGYGRVVRAGDGTVTAIVEQRDCTDEQSRIGEINTGVYVFDGPALRDSLAQVGRDNAQGEMYLTDVIGLVRAAGHDVQAVVAEDPAETDGVNDRVQLAGAERGYNERIITRWMRAGVTVKDPSTTWVDASVTLEPDVTLLPGVQLHGTTTVSEGAVIGPDCTLSNVEVGAGAVVVRTHGTDSSIGERAIVGPWSYLRPGTQLGAGGKIGAYVETKNSVLADGVKVPHLSYVGDADVATGTNIGCGTIFANYDGIAKHRTTIGAHVRIGSGTRLVPPVQVGDGAYTGAGVVVRDDVPPGALALTVAPQRNLLGWVERKRPGTDAAAAAHAAEPGAAAGNGTAPADRPPAGQPAADLEGSR
ncbi:MAG: UDP-N-acetylglucosamine diphosphorylase/glucosamine-1-phosphate N-acetyltransferase [Micrococcales bacterium]|nr:MAG: UDP-N-acetylglucosamine diphosphorylase/glucosamine-1-phosphate N-acetyltransferase [Micrococcales bacterium]